MINLHYAIKDILNTQIYYFDWRGWVLIPVDATVLELLGRWLLESRRLDKIQFQVQVLVYSLWSGHLQGGCQEEPPGLPGRSTWRRCPCCLGDCPGHQPRWARTSFEATLVRRSSTWTRAPCCRAPCGTPPCGPWSANFGGLRHPCVRRMIMVIRVIRFIEKREVSWLN